MIPTSTKDLYKDYNAMTTNLNTDDLILPWRHINALSRNNKIIITPNKDGGIVIMDSI